MKKVEIRDSVFEQIKALEWKGAWKELCDNDVFFSELIEMTIMQIIVKQKAQDRVDVLKEEFVKKIEEYGRGGISEWREKENEI